MIPHMYTSAPIAAPAATPSPIRVRPAERRDVPQIADLLLEGFGHEYGGVLRRKAGGRRFFERIHSHPGRLAGLIVAVTPDDRPIGLAGLRTRETPYYATGVEEQAMLEELGIGTSLLIDLRASLTEPPPYSPRYNEAYIYSVSVTGAWRGKGVADALLDALHQRARARGKTVALLEVMQTNQPARRLYARHGYTVLRKRRGLLAWLPFGAAPLLLMHKPLIATGDPQTP